MNDYRSEFQRFLQEQKALSGGTRASYLGDHSILVAFAERQGIEDFRFMTAGELNAFVRWLGGQKKSPATVNRAISSVRCFFAALQSYGIVQQNPSEWLTGQKLPTRKQPPAVSTGAFARLVQQVDGASPSGARDLAMFFLLKEYGVQIQELMQMDLQNVDPAANTFHCGRTEGKMTAAMSEKMRAYLSLRSRLQKDPAEQALFLNQYGKRMSRQGLWKQFKKYATQAHISDSVTPGTLFETS